MDWKTKIHSFFEDRNRFLIIVIYGFVLITLASLEPCNSAINITSKAEQPHYTTII